MTDTIDQYNLHNLISFLGTSEKYLSQYCKEKEFYYAAKWLLDDCSKTTEEIDLMMVTLIKFYRSNHDNKI